MAKKTDERDVLIVRDEKTGEISVVAGLNADGTPKRVPAKAENTKDFMTFDRHGAVIDNFFKNFYRQCKEPYRFGFYRIAAEQADKLIDAMKELLKDPVVNAELLAPHKVDTSEYERTVAEEQKNDNQNQQPQKEENMQEQNIQPENGQETPAEKRGYQPIDESKIDWNKFDAIQSLLGLTDKEKAQILSINQANDPSRLYKEVWIGLGGTQSAVYATEVSTQEYLAYTTEETEKMEVYALAEKLGGDIEAAIRQIAEKRKEQKQ